MKKLIVLLITGGLSFSLYGGGFKNKSISVFKNGLAFIQKSALLSVRDKQAILYNLGSARDSTLSLKDELKALKFGSLWFRSPNQDLHSVSRYISESDHFQPVENLKELLLNNPGEPATFIFRDSHAAQDPKLRKDPIRVAADTWTLTGDFLMISSMGKWGNAHLKDLESVEFLNKPDLNKKIKGEKLGLHLQFNSSKSQQEVEMMYVRNGIYWVPTYRLDVVEGGKARLHLVANLLNDVEDIEDCSINFVVGVPNFKFRNISTPLGSDASVAQFMQELAGKRLAASPSAYDNMDLGSVAFSNGISYNYSAQDNTQTQRFIVEPEGDLEDGMFLYTKENVSLRKGGRALINLFEETVPVEKIYHAEIPQSNKQVLNQNPTRQNVTQSYKLYNNTGRPLTHGPVFVTASEGDFIRPIANDNILFTPAGMHAYIKVADANDILLYHEEKESTGSIQSLNGWKKLSMNSSMTINNLREEPVVVELTRVIEGKPKNCSANWELQSKRKKLRKQNQLTQVKWRVELKAQQSKTINYEYTVHNF